LIQPQLQVVPAVSGITIVSGQSGTVQFSITASGPAYGVSFVCQGLPAAAGCTFSPSLIASLGPNAPMTVTMTVTTPSCSNAANGASTCIAGNGKSHPARSTEGRFLAGLKISAGCFSLALFLLPVSFRKTRRIRRKTTLLLVGLLLVLAISLPGCSPSGNGNLSPQANYTVFIKALASNTTPDIASVQVLVTQ
jgi:hypothetical protein